MANALLVILILLPAVMTVLLKSNAALGFLALCGGFAAATLAGSDIQHLADKTKITSLTSNNIELALLAFPLLLTLLLTFRSLSSRNSRYFSLLPALCAGGMLAAIAGPSFNSVVSANISDSNFWKELKDLQSYIVGAGLLSSLLLVWSGGFTHAKSHSKKHK